jgi:hypothetical protein
MYRTHSKLVFFPFSELFSEHFSDLKVLYVRTYKKCSSILFQIQNSTNLKGAPMYRTHSKLVFFPSYELFSDMTKGTYTVSTTKKCSSSHNIAPNQKNYPTIQHSPSLWYRTVVPTLTIHGSTHSYRTLLSRHRFGPDTFQRHSTFSA